jgi:acetoin utilization protein AcuB
VFVQNWMSSPVLSVPPEDPAEAARALMARKKVRRLPVMAGPRLVGILTWSDLQAPRPDDACVADVMTRSPYTVEPGDTLEHAAQIMRERKVSGLPVVENGALVGILTESDVFRAFCELMGIGEKGARVVFSVPEDDDILQSVRRRLAGLSPRSLATFHNAREKRWEVVMRVRGRVPAKV